MLSTNVRPGMAGKDCSSGSMTSKDGHKAIESVLRFEVQIYKVREEEYALDFQVGKTRTLFVLHVAKNQ